MEIFVQQFLKGLLEAVIAGIIGVAIALQQNSNAGWRSIIVAFVIGFGFALAGKTAQAGNTAIKFSNQMKLRAIAESAPASISERDAIHKPVVII